MIKKNVTLALSGGGVKGYAHVGVLKVLEKHKIKVSLIVGTSAGAIVGAMYAARPNAKALENFVLKEKPYTWKDFTFSKAGFVTGESFIERISKYISVERFSELKIPLMVTVTDMNTEKEKVIKSGKLMEAVRASMAVPGIFTPITKKKHILVDGGVISSMPLHIVPESDLTIAIDVIPDKRRVTPHSNLLALVEKTAMIMSSEIIKWEIKAFKQELVLIKPNVKVKTFLYTKDIKKIIRNAEKATEKAIPKIMKCLEDKCEREN